MGHAAEDDEDLLRDLGTAVRDAGAPTERMRAAAEAAFSWRTIDAELAQLSYDSWTDPALLVRGSSTQPRSLVFSHGALAVELERTDDALVGQLVPPTSGEIALIGADGQSVTSEADDLGCFSLPVTRTGPHRLRCTAPAGELLTDWWLL